MLLRFWEGSGGFEVYLGVCLAIKRDKLNAIDHMVALGFLKSFRRGKGVMGGSGFSEVERLKQWH
jgi:hypothetical protein